MNGPVGHHGHPGIPVAVAVALGSFHELLDLPIIRARSFERFRTVVKAIGHRRTSQCM